MDMRGLFSIIGGLSFTKDEAVVEEEIENHNNDGGENKGAGSENEFIGKW